MADTKIHLVVNDPRPEAKAFWEDAINKMSKPAAEAYKYSARSMKPYSVSHKKTKFHNFLVIEGETNAFDVKHLKAEDYPCDLGMADDASLLEWAEPLIEDLSERGCRTMLFTPNSDFDTFLRIASVIGIFNALSGNIPEDVASPEGRMALNILRTTDPYGKEHSASVQKQMVALFQQSPATSKSLN